MRRTTAATATLFVALAIGGPFAGAAAAGSTTLRCAVTSPPAACEHLDDLAAQLAPIAPTLGTDLAGLVTQARDLAVRSDQSAGVPTAEVVRVSTALRDQLGMLPDSVEGLLGPTVLGELNGTLDALVAELTAPASDSPSAAGSSQPTPAKTAPSPVARSTDTSSFGASASTSGSGGDASSDSIPSVPVGDPLTLAPLGLPDFGFDQSFEPAVDASIDAPTVDGSEVLADAVEAMSADERGAELAVVVVLSLLLIAGAGVAHLQAQRHTIPDV